MNTVELIGRMVLALVVVLGAMWALAKWARKPLGANAGQVLTVLARQPLSRTSSVAVVQVLDQALVIGVTEQGIRLLSEVDLEQVQTVLATPAPPRERGLRHFSSASKDVGDESAAVAEIGLTKPARKAPGAVPSRRGGLSGSVLSPQTWRQLVDVVRDLTARR